jgi:glycosyltransferase involved in cell wall biosynthesis
MSLKALACLRSFPRRQETSKSGCSIVEHSFVVPRNINAIADALVQILRERKRSNGREHVMHLGQDRVAQRVLGVYQAVLRSTL